MRRGNEKFIVIPTVHVVIVEWRCFPIPANKAIRSHKVVQWLLRLPLFDKPATILESDGTFGQRWRGVQTLSTRRSVHSTMPVAFLFGACKTVNILIKHSNGSWEWCLWGQVQRVELIEQVTRSPAITEDCAWVAREARSTGRSEY